MLTTLSRYPFNIPEHPDLLLSSYKSVANFDIMLSYITQMAEEPINRLEKLLVTVENSPKCSTLREWLAYMLQELPDLTVTTFHQPTELIKMMWLGSGDVRLAKDFSDLYTYMRLHNAWIDDLPVFNSKLSNELKQVGLGSESLVVTPLPQIAQSHNYMLVPLFLESMRQWLLIMRYLLTNKENLNVVGPQCFCDAQLQEECGIKHLCKFFWQIVTADRGYKRQFKKHWRKPECV